MPACSGCNHVTHTAEVKVTDPLISNIDLYYHCLVTCQLLVNLPEVDFIPVEGRKWKGFSVENFKSNLSKSALCGDLSWILSASVDERFDRYSYEMSTLLDLHIPRCRKRQRSICSHHGSTMNAQLSNVLLVDWRRNIRESGKAMTERNGFQALKSRRSIFARKSSFTALLV